MKNIQLHKKTFQELTTDELYELLRVRSEVFVVEQNCVYQDLDGDDQESIHLWLTVADKVVALARVCPAGTHMKEISIGRVITTERGKGYGKQMMRHAIDAAREHSVQHSSTLRHRSMPKASMKVLDSSSRQTPSCSTVFHILK